MWESLTSDFTSLNGSAAALRSAKLSDRIPPIMKQGKFNRQESKLKKLDRLPMSKVKGNQGTRSDQTFVQEEDGIKMRWCMTAWI
jgi:hypothetical protein